MEKKILSIHSGRSVYSTSEENSNDFNDFTGPKVKLPLFMQEVIGNLYRFILAFFVISMDWMNKRNLRDLQAPYGRKPFSL